ncbi:MAG: hypothetical protein AAF772_00290, partial [Acidobacteriota bacterium]
SSCRSRALSSSGSLGRPVRFMIFDLLRGYPKDSSAQRPEAAGMIAGIRFGNQSISAIHEK